MGFLNTPHGNVTIETRSESLIIMTKGDSEYLELSYQDIPDLLAALAEVSEGHWEQPPRIIPGTWA